MQIGDGAFVRLLGETDAQELHNLIEANRAYLSRWLAWAAGQTFDETLEFFHKAEKQVVSNEGFQAAILGDGNEEIVGVIGYVGVNWHRRSTTIGYWLDEEHQGKGLMTAAVRTLTDHALSVWQLNRVEIRAAQENHRSRAIPERLGFRQEGVLRQAERVSNSYLDSVIYSMLAAEWGSM